VLERDGQEPIVYLQRRFLPSLDTTLEMAAHKVTEGQRLDHLAALYIGDPEQFWRLCDANTEMRPDDLTAEIERRIRVPPFGWEK